MLRVEFPLEPGTVELSDHTMDRLDVAATYIERGGQSIAQAANIIDGISYEVGSFVGENTDYATAVSIRESLVANLRPDIAQMFSGGFDVGRIAQDLANQAVNRTVDDTRSNWR